MQVSRLIAAAGLVTAAIALPTARGTAASLSSPTPSCSDVLFVGVRGSGETASQDSGYGPEVAAIRNSFIRHLPAGVAVHEVPLSYDAAPVSVLLNPFTAGEYLQSVQGGEAELRIYLNASLASCHGTQQWVLAGYSQGALVVNQVIREYAALPNIAAVLLVGDPARVPKQVGAEYGTAAPGFGILQTLAASRPYLTPLPSSLSRAVVNLCDATDPVCDWSHRGNPWHIEYRGYPLHVTYESRDAGRLDEMGAIAVHNLYQVSLTYGAGPVGFFTTANITRGCPAGSDLLVDRGAPDPGFYFTSAPIGIATSAFPTINGPGIYRLQLSCRALGTQNVRTLSQALALPVTLALPQVTVTINAPRQTVGLTPTAVASNQTYPFTFTGRYPVGDGTGVATAFLCDSTGDLFVGVPETPTPLNARGRVAITLTFGVSAGPPGGLYGCLEVTYDSSSWGFEAAPVPITIT